MSCASFPPAHLRGGPARSLGALALLLGDEFDIRVITSAHDDAAAGPMPGVSIDGWVPYGPASVWRSGRRRPSWRQLHRLLDRVDPDVVHLNSLFDRTFSTRPLLSTMVRRRHTPIVLAPRGELSEGAMTVRSGRKRLFLAAFRLLRLHRRVIWHVSTELERADVERVFGGHRGGTGGDLRIQVALDPSPLSIAELPPVRAADRDGPFRIVFLSRVVPKKNLLTLLEAMALTVEPVRLTIAGPREDQDYWARCQAAIDRLEPARRPEVVGSIDADDVVDFLASFDLFVLPTFGENFGHVVLEALAAGLPSIIGRDTPWASIEEGGAGRLCHPADAPGLARAIDGFARLDHEERTAMRRAARRVANAVIADQGTLEANRALVMAALASSEAGR